MFIVIEGADGTGKTTQANMLIAHMRTMGLQVLPLVFPSNRPAGQAARHLLRTKGQDMTHKALITQAVMTSDRYDHVDLIRMHLRQGGCIVSVRWWQSGFVYGAVEGLDTTWLAAIHASLPAADLNILLDMPLDLMMQRISERAQAAERYETRAFQERVKQGYLLHSKDNDSWPIIKVEDHTPEEVHALIRQLVVRHHRLRQS